MFSNHFRKIATALFVLFTFLVILWGVGAYFFAGMDYPHISKQSSPSGKMTVHEFTSMHDNLGHAPYGRTLSVSSSKILLNPDEGYVFFAGYCRTLQYEWRSDEQVLVRCDKGGGKEGPRTLASVMYGVKVSYTEQ